LRDYGGYKAKMNPSGVNLTDVWRDLSPVRHARHKKRKANELPLKMLDRVLDISTVEGDLVVDPFGGSGTTYVVAELKQRKWVGTEIGDCDPIVQRFENLQDEREIWQAQRERMNRLFTKEAMRLRDRNGFDSSSYRTDPGLTSESK
jgi:site-specific DNA-methyltransferase (adenine-specific)